MLECVCVCVCGFGGCDAFAGEGKGEKGASVVLKYQGQVQEAGAPS